MTIATLTPPRNPDIGLSRAPESKILQADFGDGYTQAAPDGLNNVRDVTTVKWSGLTQSEADAFVDFFEVTGLGGAIPFLYQLPGASTAKKWTCKEYTQSWSASGSPGSYSIQATFRQSFNQ